MQHLTHLDSKGNAHMVDVGGKPTSERRAVAKGEVLLSPATVELLRSGCVPKGDVVAVARIAGIMAAKKTSELIPLCHPIPVTSVRVDVSVTSIGVAIEAEVKTTAQTGVEMEALTAVTCAALTVYDMVKAVEKSATITNIRLELKEGGVSGLYQRSDTPQSNQAEEI